MKKYIAEFIGTFTLVLLGCGAAVIAGEQVGFLGISFAFGFALIAMAYGIGPISGCHINPAVSLGVFVSGRMSIGDLVGYIISQIAGAIVGALVLMVIVGGTENGLGQNGFGDASPGGYDMMAGLVFEFVATLLFIIVILGATQSSQPSTLLAGLAIGITLVVIHIVGIPVTGVSVNPARSIGPALLVGGAAIQQLWLFIVAPLAAGLVAGILFKTGLLEVDA